jgi:hypothetical protein
MKSCGTYHPAGFCWAAWMGEEHAMPGGLQRRKIKGNDWRADVLF